MKYTYKLYLNGELLSSSLCSYDSFKEAIGWAKEELFNEAEKYQEDISHFNYLIEEVV